MQRLTITPSYSTLANASDAVDIVTFGDGYEQRSEAGLNHKRLAFTIEFSKVTSAKAAQVKAFFDQVGTTDAFLWTPPAPYALVGCFVRRGSYTHRYEAFDSETIEVKVEQDFDPPPDRNTEVNFVRGGGTITMTAGGGASIRYTYNAAGWPDDPTETTGTLYAAPIADTAGYYIAISVSADAFPSLPVNFHV